VLIIYAGANGVLDDLPVSQVRPFEAALYNFVENAHPDLLPAIKTKKTLDDELKTQLNGRPQGIQRPFCSGARKEVDAEPDRSPAARPLGEEHAADHQGHEDGLGGPAASRAGSRFGCASVRKNAHGDVGQRRAGASQSPDANENRLLDVRPEKRILMIVIAADRGLAGGFNANLLKMAQRFADEHGHAELSFLVIGKKSRDYYRRRDKKIFGEHVDLYRNLKIEDADRIANSIIESFTRAEVDSVYLFVNEFKNVMASTLHTSRLLPIEVPKNAEPPDYIYEQKPEELLGSLLPRYIKLQIYRALLESVAAEHAARMTAMDAASRNASEVIDKLTLYMNRVRQARSPRKL
jgi:F-type H+-transporting ATPase subunit gamma